jgi:HSP20 family protein
LPIFDRAKRGSVSGRTARRVHPERLPRVRESTGPTPKTPPPTARVGTGARGGSRGVELVAATPICLLLHDGNHPKGETEMFGSLTSFDRLFEDFRRLEQQMDQLFGSGVQPPDIRSVARGTFPPINMGAAPDQIDVYLFAAGLDPKSIEMEIQQNLLTVADERKVPVNETATYYRQERFSGPFHRVIALPEDVDPDRVEAKYRDGILQITARRREADKPRQIAVE